MNYDLSTIKKMTYLIGMLEGEAVHTIAGLSLKMGNYVQKVKLLRERFVHEPLLILQWMNSPKYSHQV